MTLLPDAALAAPAAEGELGVASRLYGEVAKTSGNLFFSPTSIRLCLGLAYAGAKGDTAKQMRTTMGYAEGPAEHAAVAAQLARWDKLASPELPQGHADPSMQQYWEEELARRTTKLHITNRLWTQEGHPFRADYLKLVKQTYRADAATVDFTKSADPIRLEINRWVNDKTEKKISQLIPPGMITADTRSVLVNAIYFKASWENAFQPHNTKPEPFFVAADRKVSAPLMHTNEHFSNATVEGAQLLELPYGDGKLSMVVVLPMAKDGLAAVEKKVAGGALAGWIKALNGGQADVTLPKFKITGKFSLGDTLKKMGMPLAFTFPGADFSGVDDTKTLYLSQVIHEALVTVDEKGTEAAAATAAGMRAGGMPQKPMVFRADHPFLFLIRDMETGAVLFMGRVVVPTLAPGKD